MREKYQKTGARQRVHGFLGKVVAIARVINRHHYDRGAIIGDIPARTCFMVSNDHASRSRIQ